MRKKLTLTWQLVIWFLTFGTIPAVVVAYLSYRGIEGQTLQAATRFQDSAESIADKIDRNLFERYGDVQAFGFNTVIADRTGWYNPSETDNPVVTVMNRYIDAYDVYYLSILVDLEGRVIAVNSKDSNGSPIDTSALYGKNFASAPWFQACKGGAFTTKMPFTAPGNDVSNGTFIEDIHIDDDVKAAYPGDDGVALGFSAPVVDASGQTIAYWSNRTKFSVVETIVQAAYVDLKAKDMGKTEITVLDSQGRVIIDFDPSERGTEAITHDPEVFTKLNLASAGVLAAQRAVAGEADTIWATHARKGILQASGFTHLKGAMGFPGMNWSVLVRCPKADLQRIGGITALYRNLAISMAVLLGLIAGSGMILGRRAAKPFIQLADSLRNGANQVLAASQQVSATSQDIAKGATTQAASIEETSASLEQINSMTRQNADNARQACAMATNARETAQRGQDAMGKMNETMESIKSSSDETAKIIRTIDEIAFQTNLLALNAAVEAARAGDAGKGFAVVAEEVRNLAQRSATAAKSTNELIDRSRKTSEGGVSASQEVGEILGDIVASVEKVSSLVSEVSAATEEQSKGITQINTAVNDLDKITQSNAASSEEAAAASEELSAQAETVNEIVDALSAIVGASNNGNGASHSSRRRIADLRPKPRLLTAANSVAAQDEPDDAQH